MNKIYGCFHFRGCLALLKDLVQDYQDPWALEDKEKTRVPNDVALVE